jgi:outer membrane protein assembly factor BamB
MRTRGSIALLLVTIALGVVPARADARGERSYHLPEQREAIPPAARVVRAPLGSNAIDTPAGDDAVIAHGAGIVAFGWRGAICAFRPADGRRLWCAGRGTMPAFAGGEIAYIAPDGSVRAVDARSGAPRWSFTFPTSVAAAALEGPTTPIMQKVWNAGGDFLVLRGDGRAGHRAPNYGELSTSGHVRWSTDLDALFRTPIVAPPYALQLVVSGALSGVAYCVQLGSGGGARAEVAGAWQTLDVRGRIAVFGMEAIEPIEDHFLTSDIAVADLRTGALRARYHFEPDYDENYRLWEHGWFPPGSSSQAGAADALSIYVAVNTKLYRYRYADPDAQRPLLISESGALLGGPYRGAIYVARRDGVWTLRADEHVVHARHVVTTKTAVSGFAIAGRTAYVGFDDGTLHGVDVDDGRTVLTAKTCAAYHIGTDERRVYAVCATGATGRIVAFPRPDITP